MSGADSGLAPNILHVLPGEEAREVIAHFGTKLRHTLVTPDGVLPAGLNRSAYLKPANDFPAFDGLPTPGRMQKLARAMTPFDLVLTYGYEALDVAMAHTLFKDAMNLPPLIHHELEPDASGSFKRKWYRRIALGKSAGLVVPSEGLEGTALVDWQQPMGRVKRIAPGIDTKRFARRPKKDGFRLIKREGEQWLGASPTPSDEPRLLMLIERFAELDPAWQLVVLGDDLKTGAVEGAIERLGIDDRVYFPGEVKDPVKVLGLFDIHVQLGEPDGFPERAVEVMAAGVPILAPRGGEVEQVVADENREWLFDKGGNETLAANLRTFVGDQGLRSRLGEANRLRAVRQFDREHTLATYRRLYTSAMKREF